MLGDLWDQARPRPLRSASAANTHTGEMRTPRCRAALWLTHAAARKKVLRLRYFGGIAPLAPPTCSIT